MSGNMAGVVQIPIEAPDAIQHNRSIYKFCIYEKGPHSGPTFSRRGISETTVAKGGDVDASQLTKIRAGDAPEVDAFEAMKVVEQLSLAEVDDVVPDGDTFKVTLRVLSAPASAR